MKIALLGDMTKEEGGSFWTIKTLADRLSEENKVKYLINGLKFENPDVKSGKFLSKILPLPQELFYLSRGLEHWLKYRKELEEFNPDLIISQQSSLLLGHRISKSIDVPHVIYLHDENLVHPHTLRGPHIAKIPNFLFSPINRQIFSEIAENADLILSCSKYICDSYNESYGFNSEVVYPTVERERVLVDEKGDKILHVNPQHHKGIDVTLEVAEQLDEEFIITSPETKADKYDKIKQLENVEYLGHLDDIHKAYSDSKMVIMPSREEPFGRVPLESGLNGIPTICSGADGLNESTCNPDLVVEENNPENYIQKIRKVNQDYKTYSETAQENALEKTSGQIDHFIQTLEEKLDIELS